MRTGKISASRVKVRHWTVVAWLLLWKKVYGKLHELIGVQPAAENSGVSMMVLLLWRVYGGTHMHNCDCKISSKCVVLRGFVGRTLISKLSSGRRMRSAHSCGGKVFFACYKCQPVESGRMATTRLRDVLSNRDIFQLPTVLLFDSAETWWLALSNSTLYPLHKCTAVWQPCTSCNR